jgi:hypothetical protein
MQRSARKIVDPNTAASELRARTDDPAVAAVLAELDRLTANELAIARYVEPQTVAQVGAQVTVEMVRTLVPRLIASRPQRGRTPAAADG